MYHPFTGYLQFENIFGVVIIGDNNGLVLVIKPQLGGGGDGFVPFPKISK